LFEHLDKAENLIKIKAFTGGSYLSDPVDAHLARGGHVEHLVHDLDLRVVVTRAQRPHLRQPALLGAFADLCASRAKLMIRVV
jgi:hypothetical protein